jgi:phage gp45-like
MIKIIRSVLKTITQGVYRTFTGDGRSDEEIGGKFVQHYGFSSRPPIGTELITLQMGNNNFSIAENDGSIKPDLDDGDVAVYSIGTTESFIGLLIQKQGNALNIMTTDGTIQITATKDQNDTLIEIEANGVNITAADDGNITVDTGNGTVNISSGEISVSGTVSINSGALTVDV